MNERKKKIDGKASASGNNAGKPAAVNRNGKPAARGAAKGAVSAKNPRNTFASAKADRRKPTAAKKTADKRKKRAKNAPDAVKRPAAAPVSSKARRASDRVVRERTAAAAAKKRPYRGGNYILYFLMFGIIAAVVLVILANTVLFKCTEIEVEGCSRYSAEEITAGSGILTGNNLLHIDTEKAEQNILNTFQFVDDVEITKSYPTKIVITITEAVNRFAITQDGKTVVISEGGRILGGISAEGLVIVTGYEAESLETGATLVSSVSAKNGVVEDILETAEQVGLSDITAIDISDRFSIEITVEDRIILNLGASTQLESKLRVAAALIAQEIEEGESVSILLTNPEKVSVETITSVVSSTASDNEQDAVQPDDEQTDAEQ